MATRGQVIEQSTKTRVHRGKTNRRGARTRNRGEAGGPMGNGWKDRDETHIGHGRSPAGKTPNHRKQRARTTLEATAEPRTATPATVPNRPQGEPTQHHRTTARRDAREPFRPDAPATHPMGPTPDNEPHGRAGPRGPKGQSGTTRRGTGKARNQVGKRDGKPAEAMAGTRRRRRTGMGERAGRGNAEASEGGERRARVVWDFPDCTPGPMATSGNDAAPDLETMAVRSTPRREESRSERKNRRHRNRKAPWGGVGVTQPYRVMTPPCQIAKCQTGEEKPTPRDNGDNEKTTRAE